MAALTFLDTATSTCDPLFFFFIFFGGAPFAVGIRAQYFCGVFGRHVCMLYAAFRMGLSQFVWLLIKSWGKRQCRGMVAVHHSPGLGGILGILLEAFQ